MGFCDLQASRKIPGGNFNLICHVTSLIPLQAGIQESFLINLKFSWLPFHNSLSSLTISLAVITYVLEMKESKLVKSKPVDCKIAGQNLSCDNKNQFMNRLYRYRRSIKWQFPLRDHPFKNLPNLPTDSTKKLPTVGGQGSKICENLPTV